MPTTEQIRQAAAIIVQSEVVTERLGGDERGFARWKANNTSFFDYKVKLKQAELSGVNADITATAQQIERSAPTGLRPGPNGTFIDSQGLVMTRAKAQRLGYSVEVSQ